MTTVLRCTLDAASTNPAANVMDIAYVGSASMTADIAVAGPASDPDPSDNGFTVPLPPKHD